MPTAHEVATELRKLADSLDKEPETETVSAGVYFSCDTKRNFLDTVRLLPHPLKKSETTYLTNPDIHVTYSSPAMNVIALCAKSLICTLVEPAKPAVYRCDPLLSDEEESELEEK